MASDGKSQFSVTIIRLIEFAILVLVVISALYIYIYSNCIRCNSFSSYMLKMYRFRYNVR